MGGSVTIWCRGPPEASKFRLYTVRDFEWEYMEESPDYRGQAYISLRNISVHRTGQYQCSYSSANHSEQRSNNLTLVLTGLFRAPLLEAHPSPVVASGRSMSLFCSTPKNKTGTFYLLKEGDSEPRQLEPQFSQGRCYLSAQSQPYIQSLPSTPLRLQVTGMFNPPSLSAQPGPLVQSGDKPSPDFSLGHVSSSHKDQYRCFGGKGLDFLWSEPSEPLDILVAGTGMGSSPELWALPEPLVPAGEDVTLLCHMANIADTFYLAHEGRTPAPIQDGTYRCSSSNSSAPHLLSPPSQPLQLQVSDYTVQNLIRIGVAGCVLLLLALLLFEAHHSQTRFPSTATR
ncbi:leukocyte immunoglobulin-like receptor subfamily A member 6 [Suncus etruscus]|uniref:leukocyte immunoglobulin-like receptor subfamily A member 6 n=1 Tax=Suncus etruscus TaxID=109475 RepID=UPI0021104437|nr:leukocyte immunoglobulin-like receptor subfamily A member 6 [Suncus etruscus]